MTTTSMTSGVPVSQATESRTVSPPVGPQVLGIGTVLWCFGLLSFVAAVFGLVLLWLKHEPMGLIVAVVGIGLGCLLLTLVKIIDALHEIACRLRNIEAELKK